MATRWQIGVIDSTGDIVSTYVHYDGSPMQVKGKVKDMTYNQVMELLDNGKNGYATLTKPYEADEHKSSWVEGHTDDLAAYMTKVKQSWSDYVYLFSEDEQQWMYAKTGQRELMPLFHVGFTEGQHMTFKKFLESKLSSAVNPRWRGVNWRDIDDVEDLIEYCEDMLSEDQYEMLDDQLAGLNYRWSSASNPEDIEKAHDIICAFLEKYST